MARFEEYKVGKVRPELRTHDSLIRAGYDELSGWTLIIGFPEMTEKERLDVDKGDAQVAFTAINSRLFLLGKFGDQAWLDAPFEPAKYANPQEFSDAKPGEGVSLLIIGADTATGAVKCLRVIGLSNSMTNALHAKCRELDKKNRPYDNEAYERDINAIYARFPDSASMLKTVDLANITVISRETR